MTPKASSRDYAWTAFAILLAALWIDGILDGLTQVIVSKNAGALFAGIAATLGYMVVLQWIMGKSQYVTYLWYRHVMRREFVDS